jgi:membrane fusion protein, copper/silver efflux system
MSRFLPLLGVAALAAASGAVGGYWLARHPELVPAMPELPSASSQAAEPAMARPVLYYRDPSGRPYWSATPKKDERGRDYLPVHEGEETGLEPGPPATRAAAQAAPSSGERKVLYYRNPMGLPDVSPAPKKDWMGMDYIPVFEGEQEEDPSVVRVSLDRVQRLGVRTEAAARKGLVRPVRAAGTVQVDERRLTVVTTKIEGWIEKLLVNATGAPVRRGQVLMQVYSPALVQAQQEYVLALRAAAEDGVDGLGRRLAEGAERRLRNLDFPTDQLDRLRHGGEAARTVALRAPTSGVVLERMAVEGMRFMPGEPLYRIADLSTVWVVAELPEQDLPAVAVGQKAVVTLKARPDRPLEGRVTFVYPTVSPDTRTGKVRVEIKNPAGELKTDMYASVELSAPVGAPDALTVPVSAVIDNGTRQVVLVERGEGRFEPRPVRLGARADGYVEVREGVREGERVVVTANFLIDAESNLQAALRAFTAPEEAAR